MEACYPRRLNGLLKPRCIQRYQRPIRGSLQQSDVRLQLVPRHVVASILQTPLVDIFRPYQPAHCRDRRCSTCCAEPPFWSLAAAQERVDATRPSTTIFVNDLTPSPVYGDSHIQTNYVSIGIIVVRVLITCRIQKVLKPKDVVEPANVNQTLGLASSISEQLTYWVPVKDQYSPLNHGG